MPGAGFLTHRVSIPFHHPELRSERGFSAAPRKAPSGSLGCGPFGGFVTHPQEQSRDTVPLGTLWK